MFQVGTGLFSPNSACTIEQYFLVFIIRQNIEHNFQFLLKSIDLRANGIFEPANLTLVKISHIHHHRSRRSQLLVKLQSRQVFPHIGNIESIVAKPISHQFWVNFDGKFVKGFAIVFHSYLMGICSKMGYFSRVFRNSSK